MFHQHGESRSLDQYVRHDTQNSVSDESTGIWVDEETRRVVCNECVANATYKCVEAGADKHFCVDSIVRHEVEEAFRTLPDTRTSTEAKPWFVAVGFHRPHSSEAKDTPGYSSPK